MEQIDPPEEVTSNVGLGPIWTDLNGNLDRKVLRCAVFGLYKCVHHRLYDWQYTYCAAQPDTGGALRPGGGTQLHGWGPNASCPHIPPNINEAERMTETEAERKGDGA